MQRAGNGDGNVSAWSGSVVAVGADGPVALSRLPHGPFIRRHDRSTWPASGNDALWSFRTRPYPGRDQDLVLTSGINAVPTTGPGEFVRTAAALDTITLGWDSPNGTHYGQPYAVFMQPFVTSAGQPAFLPPLWLNPFASLFVIAGGFAGQFPFVLPFGGGGTGLFVPPGLLGVSVLTQAVVVSGGALILSDGVEVILE